MGLEEKRCEFSLGLDSVALISINLFPTAAPLTISPPPIPRYRFVRGIYCSLFFFVHLFYFFFILSAFHFPLPVPQCRVANQIVLWLTSLPFPPTFSLSLSVASTICQFVPTSSSPRRPWSRGYLAYARTKEQKKKKRADICSQFAE